MQQEKHPILQNISYSLVGLAGLSPYGAFIEREDVSNGLELLWSEWKIIYAALLGEGISSERELEFFESFIKKP